MNSAKLADFSVRAVAATSILFALVIPGCGAPELMPTPNLYIGSDENPFESVPEVYRNNKVDVLYVTDRTPVDDEDEGLSYDYGRSSSLAFGSATLSIGEDVSWEELVKASRVRDRDVSLPVTVSEVEEKGRFPETPFPRVQTEAGLVLDPAVKQRHAEVAESLREELRERLSKTSQKEAFVYVHGYNNTFDDAVRVIGQLWHFMGREGVPIAYSWPAGIGGMRGYFYDRESGEFTIYHLKQFVEVLASCDELEKLHLIAHSRGTDVTLTAARELYLEIKHEIDDPNRKRKMGQLIVAAPDLDLEVISQRISAEDFTKYLGYITLYMSKTDTAIGLSTWLFVSRHRLGRIGVDDLTPAMKSRSGMPGNISLIDARVSSGFIGHSYFYSHPAVSSDLIRILRDERKPGAENDRPLEHLESVFWRIDEDYPNGSSD